MSATSPRPGMALEGWRTRRRYRGGRGGRRPQWGSRTWGGNGCDFFASLIFFPSVTFSNRISLNSGSSPISMSIPKATQKAATPPGARTRSTSLSMWQHTVVNRYFLLLMIYLFTCLVELFLVEPVQSVEHYDQVGGGVAKHGQPLCLASPF